MLTSKMCLMDRYLHAAEIGLENRFHHLVRIWGVGVPLPARKIAHDQVALGQFVSGSSPDEAEGRSGQGGPWDKDRESQGLTHGWVCLSEAAREADENVSLLLLSSPEHGLHSSYPCCWKQAKDDLPPNYLGAGGL